MSAPRQNVGCVGPMRAVLGTRKEGRARRNAEGDVLGSTIVVVLSLECGHEVEARRERDGPSRRARCSKCPGSLLGAKRNRQRRAGAGA